MHPFRKTALAAGVLYLITFATSIPALALKDPVLEHADYAVVAGAADQMAWAGALELLNALACVGTALVLFPLLRRQQESAALGFVTSRVLEAAVIFIGVGALLTLATTREAGAVAADEALVAAHDWLFLLGPGLIPGVNALLLGYLVYRSRLVPRAIPVLGLVGGPLLLASAAATMFGLHDQVSATAAVMAIPVALWELSLGVWMTFKGFAPAPITESPSPEPAR